MKNLPKMEHKKASHTIKASNFSISNLFGIDYFYTFKKINNPLIFYPF